MIGQLSPILASYWLILMTRQQHRAWLGLVCRELALFPIQAIKLAVTKLFLVFTIRRSGHWLDLVTATFGVAWVLLRCCAAVAGSNGPEIFDLSHL